MSRNLILVTLFAAACAGRVMTSNAPAPNTPAASSVPQVSGRSPVEGAVWPDEGPRTWAPRPTESAITANDLRTRLYQIADDSMKGRDAASLGSWKTTEYIASEFRRLGLRPAGANGSYFQEIEYGMLAYDSLKVRLSVGGKDLAAGVDWVPMLPAGATEISGSFARENVPVVFGGVWGDTATRLDAALVRGRAVVFIAPVAGSPAGRGGGAGGGRGGGRVGGAAVPRDLRAQLGGAAAILIVSDSVSDNAVSSAFGVRTALMPFTTSVTAGVNITSAAAAALFGRPLALLHIGAVGGVVSGSWTYEYRRPEYAARNVIAVLPGSDPVLRGQYVLVGAHNDHVGVVRGPLPDHDSLRAFNRVMRPQGANDRPGAPTAEQQRTIDSLIRFARSIRPPRPDSVMNGADDDGSGTALLLEIAERFATQPAPRRSIIFISHAAEEKGLLGSQYFTNHPTVPRDSIVAAHNMDMTGNGGVEDVKFGGPAQVQMLGARRLSAEFGDLIDSLNAVRSETMAIDYSWDRTNALNRFCRSDQVNYFRFAIPVTYFSTGYSIDYHMATDEPQYIDYDHSARVGRFVHEIMQTVANRAKRLEVLPLEERDMSARCGT